MIANFILYMLYRLRVMKERYPNGHKNVSSKYEMDTVSMEDAFYHVNQNMISGLIVNTLSFISLWFLLMYLLIIVEILYKEFIIDGHLRRILNKTESKGSLLDLKADLITRFAGLVIPLLLLPIIFI